MSLEETFDSYKDRKGKFTKMSLKKLMEDKGIIAKRGEKKKKLTTTDTDCAYAKFGKKSKDVNYEVFKEIIGEISMKKYPKKDPTKAYPAMVALLTDGAGPSFDGTKGDDVGSAAAATISSKTVKTTVDKDKVRGDGMLTNRGNEADEKGGLKKVDKTNLKGSD